MKKIVFLTATRADFGKLKSLIEITEKSGLFEVHIFATGMHMDTKYGKTVDEINKHGFKNVFTFYNYYRHDPMETILSNTIIGFSHYIIDLKPDLVVIHGDRVEALAGAIVGSLNNVLTAHIEGGELSGTIDDSIRHAVTKLCHIHFVANEQAKKRLIQMGEDEESIFIIGSPDIDIMLSDKLPDLDFVKKRYEINFDNYAILVFHPVTTEYDDILRQSKNLVDAVIESGMNYVVVYPNNDMGSDFILEEYKRLKGNPGFRLFSSIRFEYFLVLLKNAEFIIGNSSAGIREAPYYGTPVINIGNRQHKRSLSKNILNCGTNTKEIIDSIRNVKIFDKIKTEFDFGTGESDKKFIELIQTNKIWEINKQKYFKDI
jgi:UDP-N-acetylglucosamine 2-epimerase (hydrolysing)